MLKTNTIGYLSHVDFDGKYPLSILTSGRQDEAYAGKVLSFDWRVFFEDADGGNFIESLRDQWRAEFDVILIDSRTGLTDAGGVCTIQLPDIIVPVFTTNDQSLHGVIDVVERAQRGRQKLAFDRMPLLVFPLPSRFDGRVEFEEGQQWLKKFAEELASFYKDWLPRPFTVLHVLERTKIPYIAYFSFGERLPVVTHGTSDLEGLGYAYYTAATLISDEFKDVGRLLSGAPLPAADLPAGYLAESLADAKRLLTYAAEVGIEVEPSIRTAILTATSAEEEAWSEQIAANLLAAITRLTAMLWPVTAESLKVAANQVLVARIVRGYRRVVLLLALFIIPLTLASIVTSSLSDTIRKDVDTANKLTVQLTVVVDEPATSKGDTNKEILVDLQQFVVLIQNIDSRARHLHVFAPFDEADPFAESRSIFTLPVVNLTDPINLKNTVYQKIAIFQQVRHYAQRVQENVATVYDPIVTFVLPILYALCGAWSFLLRTVQGLIVARAFVPSGHEPTPFIIAALGGVVVGVLNKFTIMQPTLILPLCIAFLIGYAIEPLFTIVRRTRKYPRTQRLTTEEYTYRIPVGRDT